MKITCQSCGAKYTIADEKVRGRTVKIRCKKCSTAIVVKGLEGTEPPDREENENDSTRVYLSGEGPIAEMRTDPPSPAQAEWMATLDNGEQRVATISELRQLFQSGVIHDESYVWRDGMEDWLPISQVPELKALLQDAVGRSQPPQPSGSPALSPDALLAGGLFGGDGQAARVDALSHLQDLFSSAVDPSSDDDVRSRPPSSPSTRPLRFTAERGENSVLFTIDTMKAVLGPGTGKPTSVAPEEKVDIAALASSAPLPMGPGGFDQYLAAVPGGSGGSPSSLAPPTLPTEFEPEPERKPEPEPETEIESGPGPGPGPGPMMSPREVSMRLLKRSTGFIIGLAAVVCLMLIVSIALGGYFMFGGEEPVASNTKTAGTEADGVDASATSDEGDEDKTDEDKTDEDKTDEDKTDEDKKDEDKTDEDTEDEVSKDGDSKRGDEAGDESAKANEMDPKAAGRVAGSLPTSPVKKDNKKDKKDAKKDDKKDDKKDAKKDDKKDDAKVAPAATGKFSRSAAISALGSAAGAASGCKQPGGPTGRGRVSVTFAPSGRVASAVVSGPPFAGTSVGGCVAAAFRRASVPPFEGSPVTVHKSFSIR